MAPVRRLALALVTPLLATLLIAAPAAAQIAYTWSNSSDNAWLNTSNWTPTGFPGTISTSGTNTDTAIFGSTLPSGNAASIDMGSGGANGFLQLGAITFSNTSNNLDVGGSSAGAVRLNGATVNSQVDTIVSNTGSRILTIQNSISLELNAASSINTVVAASGATINIAANIAPKSGTFQGLNIPIASAGTVILSGTNNTYNSPTVVAGGTLQVNSGSGTGTGSVSVAAGGRLTGTGTIAPSSGNNVQVGGTLQPGTDNSTGHLTVGTGSTVVSFDTGGTTKFRWSLLSSGNGSSTPAAAGSSDTGDPSNQSRLVVNGALSFTPDMIDIVGLTGVSFDSSKHYSWTVATGSTASISGTQPTFNPVNLATGGGSFFLSTNGLSVFVGFTPAPEPACILLCCAAAAGVTGYVRRRRAARSGFNENTSAI